MKFNVWKLFMAFFVFMASQARASEPAFHGMVLFGNKTHYISHLPMYHAPHDHQVVAQVSLADFPRTQTLQAYDLAKQEGQGLFTVAPSMNFDLEEMIAGNVKQIIADLYSGHFERGGENLGPVLIKIDGIKYSKKIFADDVKETFQYVVVTGEGGESFAIHKIGGKPNRDIIAQVTIPTGTQFSPCNLRRCKEVPLFAQPGSVMTLWASARLNDNNLEVGEILSESTRTQHFSSKVLKIIYSDSADLE